MKRNSPLTLGEQGFSLMEVLAAFSLLGIVIAGLTPGFVQHLKQITETNLRTEGMAAAQIAIDEARLEDPQNMPSSGSASPQTTMIGGHEYETTLSYCEDASLCGQNTRHITARVNYQNNQVYEVETVFTKLR